MKQLVSLLPEANLEVMKVRFQFWNLTQTLTMHSIFYYILWRRNKKGKGKIFRKYENQSTNLL